MPDQPHVPLVPPPWLEPLERDLERTVDRLRGRSLNRLARPLVADRPGGPTAIVATHTLAQSMADATARAEGAQQRDLPEVDVHVLPDLLAVAGADLVLALAAAPDPDAGHPSPREQAAALVSGLRELRHAL